MQSDNFGIKLKKRYEISGSPEGILTAFKNKLADKNNPVYGHVVNEKVFLRIPPEQHQWWSPQMTISVEECTDDKTKTKIFENIGPNPSTYTLTMFIFFGAGTTIVLSLMWLFSLMTLGHDYSVALTVIAFAVVLIALVFTIIYNGRRKALSQMQLLRDFVNSVLGNKI